MSGWASADMRAITFWRVAAIWREFRAFFLLQSLALCHQGRTAPADLRTLQRCALSLEVVRIALDRGAVGRQGARAC
jgi:hypothetical protein